jgi:hypothetical protein
LCPTSCAHQIRPQAGRYSCARRLRRKNNFIVVHHSPAGTEIVPAVFIAAAKTKLQFEPGICTIRAQTLIYENYFSYGGFFFDGGGFFVRR